jgi:hypothetical protein
MKLAIALIAWTVSVVIFLATMHELMEGEGDDE